MRLTISVYPIGNKVNGAVVMHVHSCYIGIGTVVFRDTIIGIIGGPCDGTRRVVFGGKISLMFEEPL